MSELTSVILSGEFVYTSATDLVTQFITIPAKSTGSLNMTRVLLFPPKTSASIPTWPTRTRSRCDLTPAERKRRRAKRKVARAARRKNRC